MRHWVGWLVLVQEPVTSVLGLVGVGWAGPDMAQFWASRLAPKHYTRSDVVLIGWAGQIDMAPVRIGQALTLNESGLDVCSVLAMCYPVCCYVRLLHSVLCSWSGSLIVWGLCMRHQLEHVVCQPAPLLYCCIAGCTPVLPRLGTWYQLLAKAIM